MIKEFRSINWESIDKKVTEDFIKSMSFIFDVTKKANPISYAVFYSMQYIFWQVVVVGGILTNMKLSARLMSNSLSLFGQEPSDMLIEDNETIQTILDSKSFKERINKLIKKYGEDKENKWNFEIEIIDTYDFTDFKDLKEYADAEDATSDIFSTLLNNFGVISSEYGVLKTYNIKIKFETKEGKF